MQNNLKEFRKERNLTMQELADAAGTCKSYICELQGKDKSPSLKLAYAISKVFDVNVYDIWPNEIEVVEETVVIRRVKQKSPN